MPRTGEPGPALAGSPKIMTFVIGVGSSFTSLNQIAASGGTQQAFIVDTAGANAAGCSPTDGGWYYDNDSAPTEIILCDSTRSALNTGDGATVDVLLGCASIG